MPRGESGTAKPYLRGRIWWIKYYITGEQRPKYESSKSTNRKDAVRLLNQRRSEADRRTVASGNAMVADLLGLYVADQKRQRRHSYKQAEGYVRLHVGPAFGRIKASAVTTGMIDQFIEQKQTAHYSNASINRWLEALRRAYGLGLNALPPLVYVAPKLQRLLEDNVREGFLEHQQYVLLRDQLPQPSAINPRHRVSPRYAPRRNPSIALGAGGLGRESHPTREEAD